MMMMHAPMMQPPRQDFPSFGGVMPPNQMPHGGWPQPHQHSVHHHHGAQTQQRSLRTNTPVHGEAQRNFGMPASSSSLPGVNNQDVVNAPAALAAGMGPGMMPIKLDTPDVRAADARKALAEKRKQKYHPYSKKRQDTLYYIEDEILSQMGGASREALRRMLPQDSDWNFWNQLWGFLQHIEKCRIVNATMSQSYHEWFESERSDEAQDRRERFNKFMKSYGQLGYNYFREFSARYIFTDIDFYLLLHGFRDDGVDLPGSLERKLHLGINYLKTTATTTHEDKESICIMEEIVNLLEEKSAGACRCTPQW